MDKVYNVYINIINAMVVRLIEKKDQTSYVCKHGEKLPKVN